jgi:hypothetical protein
MFRQAALCGCFTEATTSMAVRNWCIKHARMCFSI